MNWKIDVQRGLAWTIILTFIAAYLLFAWMAATSHLPPDMIDFYKQNSNVLQNIVMLIVGYFFGSSQGSKDKDDAKDEMTKNLVDKLAPTPNGGGEAAPAVVAAAEAAAPAAAAAAAPPAAAVAAPPAAEVAVAAAMAERAAHNP